MWWAGWQAGAAGHCPGVGGRRLGHRDIGLYAGRRRAAGEQSEAGGGTFDFQPLETIAGFLFKGVGNAHAVSIPRAIRRLPEGFQHFARHIGGHQARHHVREEALRHEGFRRAKLLVGVHCAIDENHAAEAIRQARAIQHQRDSAPFAAFADQINLLALHGGIHGQPFAGQAIQHGLAFIAEGGEGNDLAGASAIAKPAPRGLHQGDLPCPETHECQQFHCLAQ